MRTKVYRFIGAIHKAHEDGYGEYVRQFGHHFNRKFAENVVRAFSSVNPKIGYDKAEEMLKASGEVIPNDCTIADLYVMVNEIKATHSTITVKSDTHAMSLAIECLNSLNHDDSETFCDWVNILHRRGEEIDWKSFM